MTTSGGGAQAPREGYYSDPSIPGYVRYWNGSAWVPGTSRPAPAGGAPPPAPPGTGRPPAAVEESGPMFLDEDPGDAPAPSAWRADPARQSGVGEDPRRVSWGSAAPSPAPGAPVPGPAGPSGAAAPSVPYRPAPGAGVPRESGYRTPQGAPPATPGGYGYPRTAPPAQGAGYGYPQAGSPGADAVPWQRQVQDLARPDGPGAAADAHPVPWRPPVNDPFGSAARPARPAGPGRRLAARLLDTLLVGAVVSAAALPLASGAADHLRHKIDAARLSGESVQVWLIDGTTGLDLGLALAALLVAGVLYEVLPTVKWGRTLGKKLLGLRVLDIESQLTPGFGQALRRLLVRQLLDLVVVGAVNAAWCLVDRPWRQCWHDKTARTFVAGDD